jgi:hypothetical protein
LASVALSLFGCGVAAVPTPTPAPADNGSSKRMDARGYYERGVGWLAKRVDPKDAGAYVTRGMAWSVGKHEHIRPSPISPRPFGSTRKMRAPTDAAVSRGRKRRTMTSRSLILPRPFGSTRNSASPTRTAASPGRRSRSTTRPRRFHRGYSSGLGIRRLLQQSRILLAEQAGVRQGYR